MIIGDEATFYLNSFCAGLKQSIHMDPDQSEWFSPIQVKLEGSSFLCKKIGDVSPPTA